MRLGTFVLATILITATPALARESVTNAVTNQGGGHRNCDTTGKLAAGKWAQVASDGAGQPCLFHSPAGDEDDVCDPDSPWNYTISGHLTFAGGRTGSTLEVRVYTGSMAGGACSTDGNNIYCFGQFLNEDTVYSVPPKSLAVPFSDIDALISPTDFQGFWIFARPSSPGSICQSVNFYTIEHN